MPPSPPKHETPAHSPRQATKPFSWPSALNSGGQSGWLSYIPPDAEADIALCWIQAVESISCELLGEDQPEGVSVQELLMHAARLASIDDPDSIDAMAASLSAAVGVLRHDESYAELDDLCARILATLPSKDLKAAFSLLRADIDLGRGPDAAAGHLARAHEHAVAAKNDGLMKQAKLNLRRLRCSDPESVDRVYEGRIPLWLDVPDSLITAIDELLGASLQRLTEIVLSTPDLLSEDADMLFDELVTVHPDLRENIAFTRALIEGYRRNPTADGIHEGIRQVMLSDFIAGSVEEQDSLWRQYASSLPPDEIRRMAEPPDTDAKGRALIVAILAEAGHEVSAGFRIDDAAALVAILNEVCANIAPADLRFIAELAYQAAGDNDLLSAASGFFLACAAAIDEDEVLASALLREALERADVDRGTWLAHLEALPVPADGLHHLRSILME